MKDRIKAWWEARQRKKRFEKLVPWYCRERCEVFGICRDRENDWKCRNGCLELKAERKK